MYDSELISAPLLALFRTVCDPDREGIHFISAQQDARKKRPPDIAFAITDLGCYWLSYGRKTKVKIDLCFRWFDATILNLSTDSTLDFTFAHSARGLCECTYRGRFAARVHRLLRDHVRRICDPLRYPEFQERFSTPCFGTSSSACRIAIASRTILGRRRRRGSTASRRRRTSPSSVTL
jgi:hypothetical protein